MYSLSPWLKVKTAEESRDSKRYKNKKTKNLFLLIKLKTFKNLYTKPKE
jgi:hypothetical protein